MTSTAPEALAAPPLDGLQIIEVSTYVAGPSGAMTLAQLGADVIRIDPIGGATDTRRLPLAPGGSSIYWAGLNKGKRSVEIDTSSEAGRELILGLLATPGPEHGILLTNAVGQGWLSHEELVKHRSDVITVHILGRSDGKPAVDYTVNCEVGLPWLTGPVELDRPVNHVLPAWDLLTGLHAAIAILAAERVRNRSGRGQLISVSLADVAVATMAHLGFVGDVVINGRGRTREGNFLYGSFGCDFATADGERVMIVALTQRHWRHLVELTGVGEAIEALERSLGVDLAAEEARYEYREVLAALLRPWFEQRSYDDVVAGLEPRGVLWGPYRRIDQFVNEAGSLLHASSLMADVDQPGIGTFPVPRCVLDMSGHDSVRAPAPVLGQHTDGVLGDVLGLGAAELDRLRADGVIGGQPCR
ncbi:MAG: CoA transferase [Acidimicrobiales bacterium]